MKYTLEDIIQKVPVNSRLTPIYRIDEVIKKGGHKRIMCRCVCGIEKPIHIHALLSGRTMSCGCYVKETNSLPVKYTHSIPALYSQYHGMLSRCYNIKNTGYPKYGGVGVTVCDEWKNDYQNFLTWALENGWKKGLHIDKDIKGNGLLYSPETCSIVTIQINLKARHKVRKIMYNGQSRIAIEVGRELGISKTTVNRRIRNGWDVYKAVTTPIDYPGKPIFIRQRIKGKYAPNKN